MPRIAVTSLSSCGKTWDLLNWARYRGR